MPKFYIVAKANDLLNGSRVFRKYSSNTRYKLFKQGVPLKAVHKNRAVKVICPEHFVLIPVSTEKIDYAIEIISPNTELIKEFSTFEALEKAYKVMDYNTKHFTREG